MERGYSIEQARNTLINSGYNIQDVNEAVSYITGGLAGNIQQYPTPMQQSSQLQQPQTPQLGSQQVQPQILQPNSSQMQKPAKKSKLGLKITILVILLIILIILLVIAIIGRDEILKFIQDLFSQ